LAAVAALGMTLAFSAACGARYVRSTPLDSLSRSLPSSTITQHVVLVSIDGLRPDAIDAFDAVTLQQLMREGSYSLAANTINPSKTLPSHTSMLTGEGPDRHHVLWNNVASAERDEIELPNVFSVARKQGYTTAAFFSKAKFGPLQLPETLDYSQAPGGWFGKWSGARTVRDVAEYLVEGRPNLLFVHLTDPDSAGHRHGWMSAPYGDAVRSADTAVKHLLTAADKAFGRGNFSVIVTADHGGHGTNHGSDDPRDVLIPWIAWGRGVKSGGLDATIRTMDTASTVVWLLGLQEPTDWAGTPVTAAFEPRVVTTLAN
jgi:arylsulfatase A-like enzyme